MGGLNEFFYLSLQYIPKNSSDNSGVRKSERVRVSQSPSDNIVRRSKSVVIHCNRTDPAQTFPLPSSDLEDHNIQENLDDIKLEIEKLIEEREKIIKENNFLQYYKERFVLNFQ